ncbi:hypothetical protein CBOM_07584 [Ceraceosorus bombacis]|uniref:Uncharacterized protein n=1 Tax=Ceraceosorus bombacis TaxID=401625 RepID=A0A0P1BH10_9BASI|nr:hypothetical protein CBOM_07584 [Ceraceosorus bombacis]
MRIAGLRSSSHNLGSATCAPNCNEGGARQLAVRLIHHSRLWSSARTRSPPPSAHCSPTISRGCRKVINPPPCNSQSVLGKQHTSSHSSYGAVRTAAPWPFAAAPIAVAVAAVFAWKIDRGAMCVHRV